ncbi:MAG: type II toxin-antitoxin system RelB/DinJ family antitoxin [Ancrocorticia sp.]
MSQTTISVRVDETTKKAAEALFSELGLNVSVAINAFLKQAVRERRIPFEITAASPNAATIEAILQGKAMLNDPNTEVFQDAASLRKALDVREDRHAR